MAYNSLENYFETKHVLTHIHKWSLQDFEEIVPWEREVMLIHLQNHLEEEKQKYREQGHDV